MPNVNILYFPDGIEIISTEEQDAQLGTESVGHIVKDSNDNRSK